MIRPFLLVALAVVAGYPAGAQPGPSFAAEATVGAGRANRGEFISGARLGVSVSGSRDAKLSPYAEIAHGWLALPMGDIAICDASMHGGCVSRGSVLRGAELILGGLLRPTRRVELRAGVGGGAFRTPDGRRVGGIVGQADATVRASAHIGVLLGTRYVVLPRYARDRLWTLPLGLRVHW